jgi:glucan 1,3-beta-glucosidase
MDSDLFTGDFASAVDQYTFDSISGAQGVLENHWQTFFTEEDISSIAKTGINALRIPIGYWAYDNANTPYITGADQYLEQAIGWARNYGMKVWVVSRFSKLISFLSAALRVSSRIIL